MTQEFGKSYFDYPYAIENKVIHILTRRKIKNIKIDKKKVICLIDVRRILVRKIKSINLDLTLPT